LPEIILTKQPFAIFSPKDIANLKNEIEKRQKDGEPATVTENEEAINKIEAQQSQKADEPVEIATS
jgi:flagellar biosynthesis/type III secretory pathway protein FliH